MSNNDKLQNMPTDAVIKAICDWMAWDYSDKEMRAEASELHRRIQEASPQSAMAENMDERDFRALEHLLAGRITCSDDLPENERPRSLNARLLFGQIFRLRTAAQTVISTRTEDFGGPEAERHERALDALRDVCVNT